MFRQVAIAALFAFTAAGVRAQDAFEVAVIKQADPDFRGRTILMQGAHRFTAQNHTLKTLIAAAYNLTPRMISGGPGWADSEHYDITAEAIAGSKPGREEQMAMLRSLLSERFRLTFHREPKELAIYELTVAKNGPLLKESASPPADGLHIVLYPGRASLPAINTTMGELAGVLQRAALDRPVADRTGLSGKYDFDLNWEPDESQFGGALPSAPAGEASGLPDLFTAIQQQLGLKLEAVRGRIDAFVIDHAERPSAN